MELTPAGNPSVAALAARVREAPARLGSARVVLIDGPAGAGKTTLAERLAIAIRDGAPAGSSPPVQVLHADDMYEGWAGLAALDEVLVGQVLEPLAAGRAGVFRRWNWAESRRAAPIHVPQREFLIVEGVGAAQRRAREFASLVVWVDAPWPARLARGLKRDGDAMRGHWERWELGQSAFHTADGTRAAAAVVVNGAAPVPDA